MASSREDTDDTESFDDSFSDDDDNHEPLNQGLGHVRRLEQENSSNVMNTTNSSNVGRELKLIGEPSGKKIKLSNSAEYASNNCIPTPHLLNNSDPVRVGAGGDSAGLPFLSESFNEFFPQKCSKYNKKSSATKIRPNLYDKISDEIIVKVFSYLNRQSLGRSASVCQRFQRIAYDESLWKRIKMYHKNIFSGVIGQVLARGTWFLSLAKANLASPVMQNQRFSYPLIQPNKVRYLDMGACSIEMKDLEELTQTCHTLSKLSLEKICNINEKVCENIVQSKDTLEILNLCDCWGLASLGIHSIAMKCVNLTELNMAFVNMSRDDIQMVCRNFTPNLIKLSLAGSRDKLLDDDVYELVNRCNRLLELDLSDASAISNKAVTHIVQHLSGTLRKLSLSRCFDIHPAKFLEVNTMPQLKNLNIFGMLVPYKLEILKKQLPHLSVNEDHLCYIARSATGDKKNQLWDVRLWQ